MTIIIISIISSIMIMIIIMIRKRVGRILLCGLLPLSADLLNTLLPFRGPSLHTTMLRYLEKYKVYVV